MNLLVHNNQLINEQPSAQQVLEKYPRGAYTTMRTLRVGKEWHIVQYSAHVKRMIESCQILGIDISNDESTLRSNIFSVIDHFLQVHGDHGELKITMLVNKHENQIDFYTHATLLPDRPANSVAVDIRKGSRVAIKGKDSIWVKLRDDIMAKKYKTSNEVLLCEEDGHVREGCSSNFFYIYNNTVYTANEGILTGTIQLLVYQVCEEMNIPLQFVIPQVKDVTQWDECFITSTSRLVLPIHTLIFDEFATSFVDKNILNPYEKEYCYQMKKETPICQVLLKGVVEKLLKESALVYTSK